MTRLSVDEAPDPRHAVVREIRDACDTALDLWSSEAHRNQQLGDVLEGAQRLSLRMADQPTSPPERRCVRCGGIILAAQERGYFFVPGELKPVGPLHIPGCHTAERTERGG